MTTSVDSGAAEGELTAHGDLVAGDRADGVAQCAEVVDELHRHAVLSLAGEHEDRPAQVAEQVDDLLEGVPADVVDRLGDVGHGDRAVPLDVRPVGELADALGGRAQLAGEVVLHRRLQGAEAVEPELGGEPDDGRRAGAGLRGEVGDGAEGDEMRALQHGLGDAPLGRRELRAGGGDAVGDLQLSHPAPGICGEYPLRCPYCGVQLPPPPQRSFASDNASGAHPDVIAAIIAANEGHALAYGDDEWTRECHARFAELFGGAVETLLTFTGTGGNVLGLTTMLRPVDAVVCAGGSHVNVDEAGAMERIAGAKLIDLPAPDGKLVPDQLATSPRCSATSTTSSRRSCRSPRAPSSAPCTPPTRWPRCASRPTRWG